MPAGQSTKPLLEGLMDLGDHKLVTSAELCMSYGAWCISVCEQPGIRPAAASPSITHLHCQQTGTIDGRLSPLIVSFATNIMTHLWCAVVAGVALHLLLGQRCQQPNKLQVLVGSEAHSASCVTNHPHLFLHKHPQCHSNCHIVSMSLQHHCLLL